MVIIGQLHSRVCSLPGKPQHEQRGSMHYQKPCMVCERWSFMGCSGQTVLNIRVESSLRAHKKAVSGWVVSAHERIHLRRTSSRRPSTRHGQLSSNHLLRNPAGLPRSDAAHAEPDDHLTSAAVMTPHNSTEILTVPIVRIVSGTSRRLYLRACMRRPSNALHLPSNASNDATR